MIKYIKEFLQFRKNKKIQDSTKPFFRLDVKEQTEDGIQVEMDWNKAFISNLRDLGYPGINDEQVVEGYLHRIFEIAYFKNVKDETLMKHSVDD